MKRPPGMLSDAPECAREEAVVPGGFSACGLDGRPRNAGQARKFAASTLHNWALRPLVADVELIVSELVGNAVRHALPPAAPRTDEYPVWLGLFRYSSHLVCAVTDPSPAPPRLGDPGPDASGGRGLFLVNSLSDSWSWRLPPPAGKTVWACLPLPEQQGPT
ncbi:ATP-binding protein [Streptomyces sp. V1I6]|uniref:ATP-binding protein n=1 Tax=Streptomyces sp. V1I6 TaxID=3042273 RepID=UPI0027D8DBB5|nr:ATP-binding protein [Streptomyces sp. V1I6]